MNPILQKRFGFKLFKCLVNGRQARCWITTFRAGTLEIQCIIDAMISGSDKTVLEMVESSKTIMRHKTDWQLD